ncbi:restriction endonuclease [Rhodohalobacter mucosus]|uniref:ATPase n=1 Tax=Rhodohalobacter mucosus TaxID=2079485 RepID=A0A316TU78_9BACT|nr:restriction endonuclease [Rhodohalobacter mucosus]PWN05874.1 ATPase [Rhodohalobacter mucosus]
MSAVNVTKYSGDVETYDESKLRKSLRSAGAAEAVIDEIAAHIRKMLYEGISTQKIYNEAFKKLRDVSARSAGRYKLKEALFELGPSGYPFEKFIGELLTRLGYETKVGVVVEGDCVSHEIDVIANKENDYVLVECKFHNRNQKYCNVKVPLYIQSRFLDVKKNWTSQPNHRNKHHYGWVVTNTRFTDDAKTYGNCVGLRLLSWDHPKDNAIKDLIGRMNLHPVTCLSSLTNEEKSSLLDADIIFCKQICENPNIMNTTSVSKRKFNRIAKEAEAICNNNRGLANG